MPLQHHVPFTVTHREGFADRAYRLHHNQGQNRYVLLHYCWPTFVACKLERGTHMCACLACPYAQHDGSQPPKRLRNCLRAMHDTIQLLGPGARSSGPIQQSGAHRRLCHGTVAAQTPLQVSIQTYNSSRVARFYARPLLLDVPPLGASCCVAGQTSLGMSAQCSALQQQPLC